MEAFIQSLLTINNQSGLIHAYHTLFGGKRYKCDKIIVINDNQRLGIKVKGKELYIPKQGIKIYNHEGNVFSFASEDQMITINVNKL